MLNRARCACLLVAALVCLPGGVAAQEEDEDYGVTVTIGDPQPGPGGEREGECANFISTWEDGAPLTGWLIGGEGERTTTLTLGGSGEIVSGGITRTDSYPVGTYQMSDGSLKTYNCVTYQLAE